MAFNICIIGCGSHSESVHGPSLARYARETPGTTLSGCCDIDAGRASRFAGQFGFTHPYTSIDAMLQTERPDAVSLVVPVESAAPLARNLLERGIPLLLEKPPGMCPDDVRALIRAADRGRTPNRVAFNRRYTPVIRILKERLGYFQPTEIQTIAYHMVRTGRTDRHFWTTAIHAIDTARFLAGSDYERVRFQYREYPSLGQGVAVIQMDCEYASGAIGQLLINPVAGEVSECATVHLHDHSFRLNLPLWKDPDGRKALVHMQNGKESEDCLGDAVMDGPAIYETGGYYFENASFYDALRQGKDPGGDLRSCIQSMEVAFCVARRLPEYRSSTPLSKEPGDTDLMGGMR